jgi:radical SAM protein with 4Fe4S-binding SPASM domain
MVSFFLTTKCNLCCEYCYNREERTQLVEQSLPLEIGKAGLDWFFQNYQSRHIRFYGPGEPTQEMELMKELVSYARLKAQKTLVELQTNGVFNNEDREWLLNNINIVWISFDGEPEVHNVQRHFPNGKPTSPVIEENIKWLIRNHTIQDIMIGTRVTITDENIERQKSMVDYFLSLGIKHIWSDPLFPNVGIIPAYNDKHKMAAFHFDMEKYVDNYIEAEQYAKNLGVFYGSFLVCNFDGETRQHCRACTPMPHFTPDGYISACDLVTFGKDAHHMDCFVYGKWNPVTKTFELYDDKILALQTRTTDNMNHCTDCLAQKYCGGYCLGEIMNETGNLYGQKPNTCKAIRKLLSILKPSEKAYPYMHP